MVVKLDAADFLVASYRELHRERGDNFFPRCALIRGVHGTSNADRWDARVTWQLTPPSFELLPPRSGGIRRYTGEQ